ncbi:hypothetical protein ACI2K4_30210 [Micromonospora sp. NPDC050397]|uniref:hypothetical protein n=1 Tax=Micromonospora sp. NPDC050397 TaxID=3364279 RepID=UPI00384CA780
MIGHRVRRAAVSLLALSVVTSGIAVIGATAPAAAAPHWQRPPSLQVGHTDSATPKTAYPNDHQQHMPLGTWLDEAGAVHTSRVYATFDISMFEGTKIYDGDLFIRESSAADCSKRAIEVWRTKPVVGIPTWNRAPAPLVKTDEILTPEFCPTASITFEVADAVRDAVQKRQRYVTFEIRVPEQYETDPSYGRRLNWYNSVSISIQANALPTVDSEHLYNGGFACTTLKPYPRLGYFGSLLQAVGSDADEQDAGNIRTTVAIWPTGKPENRVEFTGENGISGRANSVSLPEGTLVDGTSYVWQARTGDGADVSAWSKKCYFTYDRTNPSSPTVSSSNYPRLETGVDAPVGEPGIFTFSGDGKKDVAGFAYSWQEFGVNGCQYGGDHGQLVCRDPFDSPGTVRAATPGGSATVTLSPPRSGGQRLYVRSIDLAGNASPVVTYEVRVPYSTPTVTSVGGPPVWNEPVQLRFAPANGVTATEYEYTLDGGEPQTVQANEDGFGHLLFHASDVNGHHVKVRSHSSNGFVSDEANWWASFDPGPGVRSDVYGSSWEPVGGVGVPGEFVFSPPPGWTDTATYQYRFGGGEPIQVPAGPDGRATIAWTPTESGPMSLVVYAISSDGTYSEYPTLHSFEVAATP